jgi:hypothetical protein
MSTPLIDTVCIKCGISAMVSDLVGHLGAGMLAIKSNVSSNAVYKLWVE